LKGNLGVVSKFQIRYVEIVTNNVEIVACLRNIASGTSHVICENDEFLGAHAPISSGASVGAASDHRLSEASLLDGGLKIQNARDAFYILRNCFGIPNFLCPYKNSPFFVSNFLLLFDDDNFDTLQHIIKVELPMCLPRMFTGSRQRINRFKRGSWHSACF
jgi:hypothetical protein